jgi:hypothetical protein
MKTTLIARVVRARENYIPTDSSESEPAERVLKRQHHDVTFLMQQPLCLCASVVKIARESSPQRHRDTEIAQLTIGPCLIRPYLIARKHLLQHAANEMPRQNSLSIDYKNYDLRNLLQLIAVCFDKSRKLIFIR